MKINEVTVPTDAIKGAFKKGAGVAQNAFKKVFKPSALQQTKTQSLSPEQITNLLGIAQELKSKANPQILAAKTNPAQVWEKAGKPTDIKSLLDILTRSGMNNIDRSRAWEAIFPNKNAKPKKTTTNTVDNKDSDLAPGVEIVNQEPIILKYQNRDYGLDNHGQWINRKNGKKADEATAAFLDQQHDIAIHHDSPTTPPATTAPAPTPTTAPATTPTTPVTPPATTTPPPATPAPKLAVPKGNPVMEPITIDIDGIKAQARTYDSGDVAILQSGRTEWQKIDDKHKSLFMSAINKAQQKAQSDQEGQQALDTVKGAAGTTGTPATKPVDNTDYENFFRDTPANKSQQVKEEIDLAQLLWDKMKRAQ